jgi:ATP-dependent DNA helicase PIF1
LNKRYAHHDDVSIKFEIDLRKRSLNTQYDWLEKKEYSFDIKLMKIFVDDTHRLKNLIVILKILKKADDISIFNVEQRRVFDRVLSHHLKDDDFQLLLHLNEVIDTKKSLCINRIFFHLIYHAVVRLRYNNETVNIDFNLVFRCASIDVIAYNVSNATLHQLLDLLVNSSFIELFLERLERYQRCFKHCKLIIIDEKFMIEQRFLYKIDQRLRVIFTRFDVFFEEMNVLFCDDFDQLFSVTNNVLYVNSKAKTSHEFCLNWNAYQAFAKIVVLTRFMRQQNEFLETVQFRQILIELRKEFISKFNWEFLLTRTRERLEITKWRFFDEILRLHARNENVVEYNLTRLRQKNNSIRILRAKYTNKSAQNASSEDADRLKLELLLSKNARVMLTWNMWIDEELINEIINTMIDLLWHDNVKDSFFILLVVVFVAINNYFDLASMFIHDQHVFSSHLKSINEKTKKSFASKLNIFSFYSSSSRYTKVKTWHYSWWCWISFEKMISMNKITLFSIEFETSSSKHRVRDVWIFVFSWSIFFSIHSTYIE